MLTLLLEKTQENSKLLKYIEVLVNLSLVCLTASGQSSSFDTVKLLDIIELVGIIVLQNFLFCTGIFCWYILRNIVG